MSHGSRRSLELGYETKFLGPFFNHSTLSNGVETQVNFMCPTATSAAEELLVVKRPTMQVTDAALHKPPDVLEVDVEKWTLLAMYGNQ